jgi:hypothetical protein
MKSILITVLSLFLVVPDSSPVLKGAWVNEASGVSTVRIYTDGFFSVSVYKATEFIKTFGGSYKVEKDGIVETIEFDTEVPDRVGKQVQSTFRLNKKGDELQLSGKTESAQFVRLDNGTPGKLAGAWLITGRFTNGEMRKNTPGVRRTMKILSGSRFQWIAYNVETKEFFGTGGGTYTTENGKYTENIDFFSRDQSRVGMSLGFDFSIMDDGGWRHSGKSSKGDPIDEIWTQREKLGM